MNFSPRSVTTRSDCHLQTMLLSIALLLLAIASPAAQQHAVPHGWFKAGNAPDDYDVGVDETVHRKGSASAFVRGRTATPRGFGTLMQAFTADEYRGKRVRLVGYLKGRGITREAGLWLRIDGPDPQKMPLAFDRTQPRVKPGLEWTRAEIVVDVPSDARIINFGLLLAGEGQVWVDDIELTTVGPDVPVTGGGAPQLPTGPRNLDFERKPPRPPTLTDGK